MRYAINKITVIEDTVAVLDTAKTIGYCYLRELVDLNGGTRKRINDFGAGVFIIPGTLTPKGFKVNKDGCEKLIITTSGSCDNSHSFSITLHTKL